MAKKKGDREEWWVKWSRKHVDALLHYRGMCVTLHPTRGIVCIARDVENALRQESCLRRSIAAECKHVDVEAMLAKLGHKEIASTKPPLKDCVDPFDGPECAPSDEPRETLSSVAHRLHKKPTDVLIKMLGWETHDPKLNIHTWLTEHEIERLKSEYEREDATRTLIKKLDHSVAPHTGSFSAFPSPHEQPEFEPSHRSWSSGGDVVIDGAGARWRSMRFD